MFTLRKETLIERFITLSFRDKESFKILCIVAKLFMNVVRNFMNISKRR